MPNLGNGLGASVTNVAHQELGKHHGNDGEQNRAVGKTHHEERSGAERSVRFDSVVFSLILLGLTAARIQTLRQYQHNLKPSSNQVSTGTRNYW
mmetsp:Transcript_10851/g.31572  ORF Transcript_10851/g.31572 Transcript_10851/m.31572 type:complete len:94 (-) Transcript_10851:25-306(-)